MVYQMTLRGGKKVIYYIGELPDTMPEVEGYSMACIPAEDDVAAKKLTGKGFTFFDRSISLEIPLKNFRPPVSPGKKFRFFVTENWRPEEVYEVAKDTFENDCRFALDSGNTELRNELLCRFIADLRQKSVMAACLYQEESLEGFNLWSICEGKGRVLLGAVSPQYRSSGIAVPLYSHTVEAMKGSGADALRNIVASSNTAALNLHAMLIRYAGGVFRFGSGSDFYRKGITP